MAIIIRFEDIEAWRTGRELTSLVNNLIKHNQFAKDYGLYDKVRRASVSIMSNMAEDLKAGHKDHSRII